MNLPAVHRQSPADFSTQADRLSQSKLLPEHFHKDAASIEYVMRIGEALGIQPVSALTHVHVWEQNGKLKCGLSADLMTALARNAGHYVHIWGNQIEATATLIRDADNPDRIDLAVKRAELFRTMGLKPEEMGVYAATWTRKMADEAGLMSKSNWKNYTIAMLQARAKSHVVRMGASEVLMGIGHKLMSIGVELSDERADMMEMAVSYTPDELGSDTDDDGVPLRGTVASRQEAAPAKATRKAAAPRMKKEPAPEPVADAVIVEEPVKTAAPSQKKAEGAAPQDKHAQIMETMRTLARDKTLQELVQLAEATANNGSLPPEKKVQRLELVLAGLESVHSADGLPRAEEKVPWTAPGESQQTETQIGQVFLTLIRTMTP